MKVLVAVHHFLPNYVAGAEQFAYRIASGLVARGHTVQVVCVESIVDSSAEGRLKWTDEVMEGIQVRRLSYNELCIADLLRWSFENPMIETHLSEILATDRPDVVHLISGYLMGVAPLTAASRFGIPKVVTLTDYWFLCPTMHLLRGDGSLCEGPQEIECARCLYDARRRFRVVDRRAPGITRMFWRFARAYPLIGARLGLPHRLDVLAQRRELLNRRLNSADVLAPITRFLANLYAANGIDANRFVLTPYALLPREAPPMRKGADEVHFGYLGQIAPIKGVDILVRAFHQLDRTVRGARLTIHGAMGANPSYSRHLEQLARGDRDIVFAGAYDNRDIMSVMSDLDVVVVPSIWHENSPTVILEAFAAGRPVIGTNVGGISEIVRDEVNGLVFKRGDVPDLSRQMNRILSAPDLLAHLRQGIPSLPTPDEELDRYSEIYQRAIAAQLGKSPDPRQ